MSNTKLSPEQAATHVKSKWEKLTDEDVHHGLQHRETFLERICHRHHLGMDEAEDQLKAFEKSNPGVVFERY